MIRYDGYYTSEPTVYEDSIANYNEVGFFHNAYRFLPNGTYLKATKRSKVKENGFVESDFDASKHNNYEIINGKILEITYHTGEEWEFKESFEIISPQELKGIQRNLYWKEYK